MINFDKEGNRYECEGDKILICRKLDKKVRNKNVMCKLTQKNVVDVGKIIGKSVTPIAFPKLATLSPAFNSLIDFGADKVNDYNLKNC